MSLTRQVMSYSQANYFSFLLKCILPLFPHVIASSNCIVHNCVSHLFRAVLFHKTLGLKKACADDSLREAAEMLKGCVCPECSMLSLKTFD